MNIAIDRQFMKRHPAHVIALGFGAGLSLWAPGTVGTLWAWASSSTKAGVSSVGCELI